MHPVAAAFRSPLRAGLPVQKQLYPGCQAVCGLKQRPGSELRQHSGVRNWEPPPATTFTGKCGLPIRIVAQMEGWLASQQEQGWHLGLEAPPLLGNVLMSYLLKVDGGASTFTHT